MLQVILSSCNDSSDDLHRPGSNRKHPRVDAKVREADRSIRVYVRINWTARLHRRRDRSSAGGARGRAGALERKAHGIHCQTIRVDHRTWRRKALKAWACRGRLTWAN